MNRPRILIVEDEAIVARVIAQRLAHFGYEPVGQTPHGDQALVLAEQLRPDLVLMDIQLAGEMDGVSAAQAIRERLAIPVVFLTAFAEDTMWQRAKMTEPFGYIIKPFQDRELQTVIEIALYKHQAEETLRERERQLASIYDTVGDVVFQLAVDKDGRYRFTSVNRAFLATTGLAPEQVVGKRVDEVIPEPALSMVLEKYAAAIREKGIVRWEETSQYPTGRLIGEVSIAPVSDEAGHCTHLVGAVHDITERKRAEEAARASEERYRRIVDTANEGIWCLDAEYRTTFVNRQMAAMLGYSAEEMPGRRTTEFVFEADLPDHQAQMESRARGTSGHYERRFRRKDGSECWTAVSATSLRDADGRITGFFGMFADITVRKKDENRLAALELHLTHASRLATLGELAAGSRTR